MKPLNALLSAFSVFLAQWASAAGPEPVARLEIHPKEKGELAGSLSLYVTRPKEQKYAVTYTVTQRNGTWGLRAILSEGKQSVAHFDVFWPREDPAWCQVHGTISVPVLLTAPDLNVAVKGNVETENLPLVVRKDCDLELFLSPR